MYLALPCARKHEGLEDLAMNLGADVGAAPEVDRLDKLVYIGFVTNIVALSIPVDKSECCTKPAFLNAATNAIRCIALPIQ
jgi:hypothetical protein